MMKKTSDTGRSEAEIRQILLEYFYNRYKNATSARGKKGVAVKISDIRKDLKETHGLKQQQIVRNISYLVSQGWIEEDRVDRNVHLPTGYELSQPSISYKISASGVDKIEGPGEFTMEKFKGIKIEATGQNIITVGDGNQVNVQYQDAAKALVDLKRAIQEDSTINDKEKLEAVSDIDSIQSQLAKAKPNQTVIRGAWEGLKDLETVLGLATKVAKVSAHLAPLFS
jgi:hypothetical protein